MKPSFDVLYVNQYGELPMAQVANKRAAFAYLTERIEHIERRGIRKHERIVLRHISTGREEDITNEVWKMVMKALPLCVPARSNPRRTVKRVSKSRLHPRITTTYSIITPESAEVGDFDETGWIDEDGVDMDVDKYDRADKITVVDKAVKFLRGEGANEPSNSHFNVGTWYSNSEYSEDYSTGAREERSFHLEDFTPRQEEEIFKRMRGR